MKDNPKLNDIDEKVESLDAVLSVVDEEWFTEASQLDVIVGIMHPILLEACEHDPIIAVSVLLRMLKGHVKAGKKALQLKSKLLEMLEKLKENEE